MGEGSLGERFLGRKGFRGGFGEWFLGVMVEGFLGAGGAVGV